MARVKPRASPWALVPAAEYEKHMGPEGARELAPLAAIFGKIYTARRPRRLAVLGVGTGHGLEHVDVRWTGTIVGVDVNLSYLAVTRLRQMRLGATLQLHCADVEKVQLPEGAFDLVHAALLLEYVDLRVVLPRVARALAPGGALSAVLYLPGGGPSFADAAAPSVKALASAGRLVPPDELRARCAGEGLAERRAFVVTLSTGRRLFVALYEREGEGGSAPAVEAPEGGEAR